MTIATYAGHSEAYIQERRLQKKGEFLKYSLVVLTALYLNKGAPVFTVH